MKLLFCIAHYYRARWSSTPYDSHSRRARAERARALTESINRLHAVFGRSAAYLSYLTTVTSLTDVRPGHDVDIVVCTTPDHHLLDELPVASSAFRREVCRVSPMFLPFECHAVLAGAIGTYDYYCYLEDDLVIHDPWYFLKLQWFGARFGSDCLLQPQRFEVTNDPRHYKLYNDGDLPVDFTRGFQDVSDRPSLCGRFGDVEVEFMRPLNPHAGCFFLSQVQMESWSRRPDFLDRDTGFVGPLESAATLGIARAFRVYKPSWRDAAFFEIQHFAPSHARRLATRPRARSWRRWWR